MKKHKSYGLRILVLKFSTSQQKATYEAASKNKEALVAQRGMYAIKSPIKWYCRCG